MSLSLRSIAFVALALAGLCADAAVADKAARPQVLAQVQVMNAKLLAQAAAPKGVSATKGSETGSVTETTVGPGIMSYSEWKTAKVGECKERIQKTRFQYNEIRKVNPRSPILAQLRQELTQEQWNLEVAQDLSAKDYLFLYVKGQDGRKRLPEIAARLSPEEISEFLESYFQMLENSNPAPSKRNRLGNQAQ